MFLWVDIRKGQQQAAMSSAHNDPGRISRTPDEKFWLGWYMEKRMLDEETGVGIMYNRLPGMGR